MMTIEYWIPTDECYLDSMVDAPYLDDWLRSTKDYYILPRKSVCLLLPSLKQLWCCPEHKWIKPRQHHIFSLIVTNKSNVCYDIPLASSLSALLQLHPNIRVRLHCCSPS